MSAEAGAAEVSDLAADGVFSGGGIKGLAFAGALVATEEAGYREWHEPAGTSAGAITAMALAAGYDASLLAKTLDAFDFGLIADYGSPVHLLGAVRDLIFHESVVKGDELTNWVEQLLDGSPVQGIGRTTTFAELTALTGRTLVVVGTDLAHSRMVEFPRDIALYQDENGEQFDPDRFPIAKAVRISACYPFFFSYRKIGGVEWPVQMLEGILDTAMNALDKFSEKRFEQRVIPIPTGEVSTLNFNLSKQENEYLYNSGLKSAREFFARSPRPENSYGKLI